MKCTECGSKQGVIKSKHLPLPDGGSGHITLTKPATLCVKCRLIEAKKFDELMFAARKELDEKRGESG